MFCHKGTETQKEHKEIVSHLRCYIYYLLIMLLRLRSYGANLFCHKGTETQRISKIIADNFYC